MKKRIAILALIVISNLANAQLNENQNEFIKVNQNNLLNDEEGFQENKILVFGNFNFYNKNSRHSNNFKRKSSVKPPITPEVDLSRPIEDYEPLRPEKDPLRPIDDYEPLRPERDPLRPIEDFEPITPTMPASVIIWKNGEEINGITYTLTESLTANTADGLRTEGGEVINDSFITTTGNFNGIKIEDGIGTNNGSINVSGDGNGMVANRGEIINGTTGEIQLNRDNGIGMSVNNGKAVNNGKIVGRKENITGMSAQEGELVNNGEISLSGQFWDLKEYNISGMTVEKGSAVNNGTILTYLNGDVHSLVKNLVIGMRIIGEESTGINQNEIRVGMADVNYSTGEAIGMLGQEGATVTNKGSIFLIRNQTTALKAESESTAINEGIIDYSDKRWGTGIHASTKGVGINKSSISVYDNGNGMKSDTGGTVINEGTINGRVWVTEGGTAINKGTINGEMKASKIVGGSSGGTLINEESGIINVGYHDIGMEVKSNSTGINKGTINLTDNDGIGIYVDSTSLYTNTGTINIISGTTGNQKIVTETGSKMINSGKIVSEGEFNTSNGQFIMSDGGSLEADKIKGDIYASGALAMGGYDDIYSTYKMLKTTNLEGEIISNSAMFGAHFTENSDENGFYDVVLDRKDFNTIVSNEELGKILEDNYEENGDKFKEDYYDALKLVTTEKGLNKAAEDSYGMSYYPTLAKQTFEIINDSNQVIVNNVIDNVKYREVDETIAVAGVNVTRLESDSYDNVSEYDTDLYSVYLGAEKQLSKNTRIGGIITIGKSNTEFKDNEDGPREDYYYQGNLYLTYENDERLKFTSMVFGGITDTSLERTLAFGSLNETITDDINNYYLGINNEVSRKYYFNRNYIKPKFEINFTYMMQDDISESGDQGLEIDGVNSISLETGIGLALGRDFYLESRNKINLEGSVTGYAELGNPYKDLNSIFNTLSTDKVKIDGYNNDDFYGEVLMGGSYETEDLLTIYTKVGYKIGNDSSGFIGNIGMNYLF